MEQPPAAARRRLGGGGPTPNALNELQSDPNASLTIGTTPVALGTPYAFSPTSFGVSPPGLELEYATAAGGIVRGLVEFTGTSAFNNLLLTVDPDTGEARLQNSSPFEIELVGYSILSQSGSLRPGDWLSLEDQGLSGWEEAAPTANVLSELIASGTLTLALAPGGSYLLGSLFDAASGVRDLELEFALDGELAPRLGVVHYAAVAVLDGDFNGDGRVDAADYTVWRDGLGTTHTLAQYDLWKQNFGATAGSGALAQSAAVPEPASLLLVIMAAVLMLGQRGRHRLDDPR